MPGSSPGMTGGGSHDERVLALPQHVMAGTPPEQVRGCSGHPCSLTARSAAGREGRRRPWVPGSSPGLLRVRAFSCILIPNSPGLDPAPYRGTGRGRNGHGRTLIAVAAGGPAAEAAGGDRRGLRVRRGRADLGRAARRSRAPRPISWAAGWCTRGTPGARSCAFRKTTARQPGSTEPYALAAARAIRERLETAWSLAESGAAGPTGNSYGDPAGHCCFAVSGPVERTLTVATGDSDREANMWAFARAGLGLLEETLRGHG